MVNPSPLVESFHYNPAILSTILLTLLGVGLIGLAIAAFAVNFKKIDYTAVAVIFSLSLFFIAVFMFIIKDIDRTHQIKEWAEKEYGVTLTTHSVDTLINDNPILVGNEKINMIYDNDSKGYLLIKTNGSMSEV